MSGQHPTASDIFITQEGIKKLLNGLNPHKAAGTDNISSLIRKELADEIAPILQLLLSCVSPGISSLGETARL